MHFQTATMLQPYLHWLKCNVEKELPSKFEHLILCPFSKWQQFLYDKFTSQTHDALHLGVYQKIANILVQLHKVYNHLDLFELWPMVQYFNHTNPEAMESHEQLAQDSLLFVSFV